MVKLKIFFMLIETFAFFTTSFSQQISYDFVTPLPPESNNLMAIPPKLFGIYQDSTQKQIITVKQRGIFMQTTVYGQLPVAVVDTSTKYTVRNESIFGIVENDSLPCFKRDSVYYFGMHKTSEIFSFNGQNAMCKVDPDQDDYRYIVCTKNQDYWIPTLFVFEDNKLHIKQASYEEMTEPFKNIVVQFNEEKNKLTYIHLHPSLEEWKTLDLNTYFGEETVFLRK